MLEYRIKSTSRFKMYFLDFSTGTLEMKPAGLQDLAIMTTIEFGSISNLNLP